jgi:ferritin-like metal-binding protein YciE
MALDTVYELLMNEMQDIYHAENQLLATLPRLARAATSPSLRQAMERHLAETEDQVSRLEQAFAELGVAPRGRRCKAMEGLLEEGKELLQEEGHEAVLDAALISAARRVEHYEIAAYGSIVSFARLVGESQVATLMGRSLEEEITANQALSRIAETEINPTAATAGIEEELEA